jgi:pullulanase
MEKEHSIQAYLDDYGKVHVLVSHRFYNGKVDSFYIKDEFGNCNECIIRGLINGPDVSTYDCIVPAELNFGTQYTIVDNHGFQAPLEIRFIVRTQQFEEMFEYTEDDLGCSYTKNETKFAVWAPTATKVIVSIRQDQKEMNVVMKRTDKGVYRATVNADLKTATYVYLVSVNGEVVESSDPYAISCTSNGKRSAVLDLNELKCKQFNLPELNSPIDAILYECSVRDMTSSSTSGSHFNKKFKGLVEPNTRNNGRPTGYDYIRLLGITHVQLLPAFDFATVDEDSPNRQYNWGYDPLNFFCPEGSFSMNPNDPFLRVQELREVVDGFHEAGIRVNLDLVLNHHYDLTMASLQKIVPYYYFRYNENGLLSNGSFCGNDTDSCRKMTRKYFIDNIKMWMNIYGIDGFRFDLMGILDVDTMNEIVKAAKEIKKDVMIYGEGWNLPTYLPEDKKACMSNNAQMPEVAHFNDYFRDSVKGKSSEGESFAKGYCTGDGDFIFNMASSLAGSVKGSDCHKIFMEPHQTVNYVECHDNQTSWDKIKDCCKEDTREIRIQKHKMLIGSVMFAQGIPFLQAGQEFCRTKLGYHNTFSSSDSINQMDWDRMIRYEEIVKYTRTCILLRKKFEAFRLKTTAEIEEKVSFDYMDANVLVYTINHPDSKWKCRGMKLIFNPFGVERNLHFNDKLTLLMDENGLLKKSLVSQDILIKPYSLLVCAVM